MRRRPTRKALTLAAVGALLVLAASTAQAGWLFVLAAGVFGLIASSLFMRHALGSASVGRDVPSRMRVGDEVRTGITITNGGGRRLPLLTIEDSFPAFAPITVSSEPLRNGEQATVELARRAVKRGHFSNGGVALTSGAPFGLLRSRRTMSSESPAIVVPRWADLRSFPLLEPSSFPAEILHERARTGAGEEYLGVREYRPGDPRRHVHWRSSARAGKLIVREFQEETVMPVAIALSGPDHGAPPESSFEALVSAAASIALYALVTGHPVELVRNSSNGPQVLSEPERAEVLEWLAAAEPADGSLRPLVERILRGVGKRATVVLCTPSAGAAGSSIVEAVRFIQAAGSRAIPVVAHSATWDGKVGAQEPNLEYLGDGRAHVRHLVRGKDLGECLAA